jgi:hypothetical protein
MDTTVISKKIWNISFVYPQSHPEHLLEVVKEADAICRFCPHLQDGHCSRNVNSGHLMEDLDLLVMKRLDIVRREEFRAQNIFSRVDEVFNTQKDWKIYVENAPGDIKCLWLLSHIQWDE